MTSFDIDYAEKMTATLTGEPPFIVGLFSHDWVGCAYIRSRGWRHSQASLSYHLSIQKTTTLTMSKPQILVLTATGKSGGTLMFTRAHERKLTSLSQVE